MEQEITKEKYNELIKDNEYLCNDLKTYKEFIDYLADKAKGDTSVIIGLVNDNETNKFCGYVEAEKLVRNSIPLLKFAYNGLVYIADWYETENYGAYQNDTGFDYYYGFMLLPANDGKYFLMEYTC